MTSSPEPDPLRPGEDPSADPPPGSKGDHEATRAQTLESELFSGCMTLGVASIMVFAAGMLPAFLGFPVTEVRGLGTCMVLGVVGVGVIALGLRRLRPTLLTPSIIGGGIASAAFYYMRMNQLVATTYMPTENPPEWPPAWQFFVPMGWLLVHVGLALVAAPSPEDENTGV